jgi:hypothetical protein
MPIWNAFPYVLFAMLVVLLPVGVIGLSASKLDPRRRTGFLVLYGATVLLLAIVAFDVTEALANRAAVDLSLLAGGAALGLYADRLFRPAKPDNRGDDAS